MLYLIGKRLSKRMFMYAETMLVPAIPDLIKNFNITYSKSSWILTTYLLTGAVMAPIVEVHRQFYAHKVILEWSYATPRIEL
jgi:predicted MFS family arabinose efflux permease